MRLARLLAVPVAVAMIGLPAQTHAQVNLTVRFGTRLGPDAGVYAHSQERMGD